MAPRTNFTTEEARRVGEQIGIDWSSAPSVSSSSGKAWRSNSNASLEPPLAENSTSKLGRAFELTCASGKESRTRLNLHPAICDSAVGVFRDGVSVGWGLFVRTVGRLGGRRTSCSAARDSRHRRHGRPPRPRGEDDQRGTPGEDERATDEQPDREPEQE